MASSTKSHQIIDIFFFGSTSHSSSFDVMHIVYFLPTYLTRYEVIEVIAKEAKIDFGMFLHRNTGIGLYLLPGYRIPYRQ